LKFIQSRVSSPDDAQDILQNVFLKVHIGHDAVRDNSKMVSWLFQITRNAVNDYYRSQKLTTTYSDIDALPYETPLTNINDDSENESYCACYLDHIKILPHKYRDALYLHSVEGLKQQEIAQRLHVSLSGVKSRIARGKEQLKKELIQCCKYTVGKNNKLYGEHDCLRCDSVASDHYAVRESCI
jgi:RNA polymerase sigma-70 factor (ECF subfamily)